MSDLEQFQKNYGQAWAGITQSPAFIAAFTLANVEKLQAIALLTDEEINANGKIILADLRGHLKYENGLLALHQRKEFVFQDLPRETYPSPEEEALEEEKAETQTGNNSTTFSTSEYFVPPVTEQEQPQPRKKRKYTRRKK